MSFHFLSYRGLEWGTEETLFKSGLRVCPKNAKVHYNIAKLSNDSDIAIEHYTRALDLWPSYEHAMNNLGNIYKNIGEFEQAEILFLKVPFIYYVSTCISSTTLNLTNQFFTKTLSFFDSCVSK